jgi:hypothetical protein
MLDAGIEVEKRLALLPYKSHLHLFFVAEECKKLERDADVSIVKWIPSVHAFEYIYNLSFQMLKRKECTWA